MYKYMQADALPTITPKTTGSHCCCYWLMLTWVLLDCERIAMVVACSQQMLDGSHCTRLS